MVKYSPSRLSSFLHCPLKYKLAYIDKMDRMEETIEAFLGSRVHEALEELYKKQKMGKILTLEDLLSFYKKQWEKRFVDNLRIIRKEFSAEDYKNKGIEYLTNYYKKHYPFNDGKTIALEKTISFSFEKNGKKYELFGIIDRLAKKEDMIEIHDYKTSMTLPTKEDINQDKQLSIYNIGIKDKYPNTNKVKLIWHYLAFNEDIETERTEKELEEIKNHIAETIDKIESMEPEEFKPKPSELCQWCEFAHLCPLQKHLVKIKQSELNEFLKDDGVKLVNRYVELSLQKKEMTAEIDSKLEKIKEAMINFAQKNNLQVIAGSTHKIKLFSYDHYSFQSDEENKEKIIRILEENNLLDNFRKIDFFALSRALNQNQMPEEIAKKIEKASKKEKRYKIYLSRISGNY